MTTFEREAMLPVSLDTAWAFHESVAGLLAVTPDWLHATFEAWRDPDGEWHRAPSADRPLEEDSVVALSVQPLGAGPRVRWQSAIDTARLEAGTAILRDRMLDGPFEHWVHTHALYDAGDETRLWDRIEYRSIDDSVGDVLDRAVAPGLWATFRYRHRRTRRLLARGWDGW